MASAGPAADQPLKRSSSFPFLPPDMSELRVVLLGSSWSERSSVGNFLLGKNKFYTEEEPDSCVRVRGQMKDKDMVLINTPDLLHPNLSAHRLTEFMENCVRLSAPGPHVFLLVLQPEDFTEDQRLRLQTVLEDFSDQSFNHSLILISEPTEESSAFTLKPPPVRDLISLCRPGSLRRKDTKHEELLARLGQIVKETKGKHLSRAGFKDQDPGLTMTARSEEQEPALNLVLCGSRAAEKTSAAEAILGQTELHSVCSSSETVGHQTEVCGRWVSLLQLPALDGKAQEAVMEESFRCVSLCDPEGVHAFILVLPVAPLTDEDKAELQIIQKTFSSRVNDFTIILFTVDSDPSHPAVDDIVKTDKDIQELCQSCGGRSVLLNIRDRQQVSDMLDTVDRMTAEGSKGFTMKMFTKAQTERVSKLEAELQEVMHSRGMGGDDGDQSREPLRMLLVGMSDGHRNAAANTILSREHFKPRVSTKTCEKATGVTDGRPVSVVNTAALFDTTLSDDEIQQELQKCIGLLAPGPHVFLLVLQIGSFTQEEREAVNVMKKYFGQKSERFTIIIFTGGAEEQFESYSEDSQLKKLIRECGGRYQLFSNRDSSTKCTQVQELLAKIDRVGRENGGPFYTTEMFVEAAVQKKKEEISQQKDKEIQRERREVEQKQREMEQMRREKTQAEQALKEREESMKKERAERKKEQEEEERRRKKQEESLRQDCRRKLDASEKRLQSEREQREKEVEQCRREMKRAQENWDKERKSTWERVHQEDKESLQEEKARHRRLQEEYHQKRRKWTYSLFVLLLALCLLLIYILLSSGHTHTRDRAAATEQDQG
ncbi:GTPase IMAP family member 8-like [Parambassis ranga]|uniref:GTPase IMAP family member 8-like n=1 Tax=Parambassis ranga TaxID=210632 RepID=A0A6P7IYP3_9TELE|nr:GTPase IMAP family member 8-like [Parambassis ranga]XP_028269470.1 GTPase IMAP family member 8-like [Parambassis ranga]XP_028269471.1 GTPase IMAP family member 8-like [Parambassis ranga]